MLPAYARQVVNDRAAGRHPACILIGLGNAWFRVHHPLWPYVYANDADLLAGKFDWWWTAGVPCYVESQSSGLETTMLLAQLAVHTAPITLNYGLYLLQGMDVWQYFQDIAAGRLYGDAAWVERNPDERWHCQFWSCDMAARYLNRAEAWRRAAEQGAAL